jgi:GNAT superfamily N-acetyltransferase
MSQTAINYILKGREEFFTSIIQRNAFPKTEIQETSTHTICMTGINLEFGNVVWQRSDAQANRQEMIQILDMLKDKELPFLWWEAPIPIGSENNASTNTSMEILTKNGLQVGGLLTGIWTHLDAIHSKMSAPAGVTIRPVQSLSDLNLFCQCVFPICNIASHVVEQLFMIFEKSFLTEEIHYLAYQEEKPIGGITLAMGEKSAGLWNFAILESHRKQGIGSALIQAALMEAKQRGYQDLMAILMPTEIGNLWRQFHFQEVCHFPFYVGQGKVEQTRKEKPKRIRDHGWM